MFKKFLLVALLGSVFILNQTTANEHEEQNLEETSNGLFGMIYNKAKNLIEHGKDHVEVVKGVLQQKKDKIHDELKELKEKLDKKLIDIHENNKEKYDYYKEKYDKIYEKRKSELYEILNKFEEFVEKLIINPINPYEKFPTFGL